MAVDQSQRESACILLHQVLEDAGKAKAYWVCLNSIDPKYLHISSLFGCKDISHFQEFCIIAGFARRIKKGSSDKQQFQFQKPKFEKLLSMWQMQDSYELTLCQPNVWFLRVGYKKPREKIPPPYQVEDWKNTSRRYSRERKRANFDRLCSIVPPLPARQEGLVNEQEEEDVDIDSAPTKKKQQQQQQEEEESEERVILVTTPQRIPAVAAASTCSNRANNEPQDALLDLIKNRFLKILVKNPEEIEWRLSYDQSEAEKAIKILVRQILQEKEKKLGTILGCRPKELSPVSKAAAPKQYPFLSQYHVPLTAWDQRIHHGLLIDLYRLNKKSNHTSTLSLELGNNRALTKLVHVPQSKNRQRMSTNNRLYNWLNEFIEALSGGGDDDNIATTTDDDEERQLWWNEFMIYLASAHSRSKQALKNAAESLGVSILPRLGSAETVAIQSSSNLTYCQMRELRKNIAVFTGGYMFASEQQTRRLGDDFVPPTVGEFMLDKRTKIPWATRSLEQLVCYYVQQVVRQRMMRTNTSSPSATKTLKNIFQCDVSVSIDHGKGYSRATLVVVLRYSSTSTSNDGTRVNDVEEDQGTFALANAKCKKDSYHILKSTYAPSINQALAQLRDAGSLYCYTPVQEQQPNEQEAEEVLRTSAVESSAIVDVSLKSPAQQHQEQAESVTTSGQLQTLIKQIPLGVWMGGDGLYLATAHGKEGSSTYWCCYCDLSRPQWQKKGHTKGSPWTLHRIRCEHLPGLLASSSPQQRKGFKHGVPMLFDSVKVEKYVITVLHLQLGVVNGVFDNFIEKCQSACEQYTDEYVKADHEVNRLKQLYSLKSRECVVYEIESANDVKELSSLVKNGGGCDSTQQYTLEEVDSARWTLESIQHTKHYMLQEKEVIQKEIQEAQQNLLVESAKDDNSKKHGQPVRAQIESIGKAFGIDRAAYHGGDIQGPGCRVLMGRAAEIMEKMEELLLGLPMEQKGIGDAEISSLVDDHKRILMHMDALFSILRKRRFHVTTEDMKKASVHRDRVVALWRQLGKSVTPKMHVIESHAVEMLERHVGYGDLGEDAGEHAHQLETKNEKRVETMPNHREREIAKCRFEAMRTNAAVKVATEKLQDLSKRVYKKRIAETSVERQARKKMARHETRDSLLDGTIEQEEQDVV